MTQNHDKKRPAFEVLVSTGEGDRTFWTKIGGAWAQDDGEGYNITLSAHPIGDRMILRVPREPRESDTSDRGRVR